MTSAMEFTYLYDDFSLRVNESVMTRAVRVKTAVKDKIKRIFDSKKTVVSNDKVVSENNNKESLLDLSNEKLLGLNDVLNTLQTQQSVPSSSNRAVLFTKPLVAKIFRVTDKWFAGMPVVEKKEAAISNDIPSVNMINHLGGEIVPGNWSNVEENTVSIEPAVNAAPEVEPVTPVENSVPTVNIDIPVVSEHTDIYKFPSFDFTMESVAPSLEPVNTNTEVNLSPIDFVPEPKSIDEIDEKSFVPEPTLVANDDVVPSFENNDFGFNIPNFEQEVSAKVEEPVIPTMEPQVSIPTVETVQEEQKVERPMHEMEVKINELLNKEFTPNPANNYVPEHNDDRAAEERIDSLLGRTSVVQTVAPEISVPAAVEEPIAREEKPEITQGQVLARLRRVNNTMAEKDSIIKSLTAKNDSLKEEVAVSRDKISEYEVKVSDLSAKNSDLSSQNERLSSRLEEVETNSKSTIARLETKVSELTQSKTDELESLRKQLEELKEKHSSEIASMREKHATELRLVNETKDKQIQAIYNTITEALGDDDYSKGMAA